MKMARLAAALALALAGMPGLARACSGPADYVPPTNYQLVRKAELIVLARVERGPTVEELVKQYEASKDQPPPQVVLTPIRAIKGMVPAAPLVVEGAVGSEGKAFTQHPTPLTAAHPSTYAGACIRQDYAVGALVVAIFVKGPDGVLRQESSAFARSVEDVEGEHGTWVRAAETYAAIDALPTSEARAAALQAEAARLLALHDDAAAPAIAADILDQARFRDPAAP